MFCKRVGMEMMRCWDCGIAAENVGEEESVMSNYATTISRVARDAKKSVTQDARREEKRRRRRWSGRWGRGRAGLVQLAGAPGMVTRPGAKWPGVRVWLPRYVRDRPGMLVRVCQIPTGCLGMVAKLS